MSIIFTMFAVPVLFFDGSVEKWIAVSIWYQDLALFRENRSDWHRIIEFSMSSRLKDFLLPVMMC